MDDTLEKDIAALSAKMTETTNAVKNYAEDMIKRTEAGAKISAELQERTDKALAEQGALAERLAVLEQRAARRGGDPEEAPRTLGQIIAESDELKNYAAQRGRFGRMTMDAPKGATIHGNTSAAGGALRRLQYVGGIIPQGEQPLRLRDILMAGASDTGLISYTRETGFTNNARVQSETTAKAESNLTFEQVTSTAKTIAHYIKASKQILADVAQLRSFIDGRLTYGLKLKEEAQFLTGSGVGNNVEGLITAATAYSAPFSFSGSTMIDQVRLAMLQAALAEYPCDGVVMHDTDWARIETLKDDQGRYIIGQPQGATQPRLWNRPVVASQSISVDKFLVGAFGMGAQIFDREGASVQISDEDGDNFTKNMVTILVEERTDLAIYRPEAFIYGDFGNV